MNDLDPLDSTTPGSAAPAVGRAAETRARYIMIGGFLGAGKTTAVARLAGQLAAQGLRVGLITNDQGSSLVDTALLTSRDFPVEEIAGGCFCCRFNSLMEAAHKLSATTRPDVFIAEPVGSCTDLVATVTYPLRRIYGDRFTIAPLSVLIDPVRALRMFGLEDGPRFSPKVAYIYRKQLEEADVIVVNKGDLLDDGRRVRLSAFLEEHFPGTQRFEVSARTGRSLGLWFDHVASQDQHTRAVMEVDYDLYAEGESLLGWLNATVELSAKEAFDGNEFLRHLASAMQSNFTAAPAEVAHLKMTLDPQSPLGGLAVINLVRNDYVPELSQTLDDPLTHGQLIINVRAEVDPDHLRVAVESALRECGLRSGIDLRLDHIENFRPGRPVPTHRMT